MRTKNQQGAKRASKAEQLYQESWRIPSVMEGQHSLSDFVYASATAARVDHDDPSIPGVFGAGPPPPLPPKQKQQLARTGRPLSQQFADEPIYAPVPINRRKAVMPASASPSRAMMTKRHSVETQTDTGGKQVVPVSAAGYGPRRHSETPARGLLREQNSGGVPQKTHEK